LQSALGQGYSFVIGMHALVCLQWVGYLVKVSLAQVNKLSLYHAYITGIELKSAAQTYVSLPIHD